MKRQKLLAAALAMLMLLTACAGDPDTSSVSPAPSESTSTVVDADDTSAQPDESQPAGDEGAASTPSTEPEKEPDPVPEQTPDAEPEKEPEKEPAPEVIPTPDASETTPPAHTHEYGDKVVAPTCEKGGYTVHTCDCGHSYSDKETKATGHSYTEKVVAPTTSAKGYTLHTCSKCGTSYKDSYVDKLPTEKPAQPSNPGDSGYEEGGHVGETQTSGGITVTGSNGIAGQFTDVSSETREFYTPGMDRDQAESAINGYVGYVYSRRFFDDGISMNYADPGKFAKIVENNGKLGVNVFQWRKSYDSDFATNSSLNMVMEAFYFFTKDKDVAHALWSWVDAMEINGRANSDSYGFRDVVWNDNQKIIEMNGIQIEYVPGNNGNTFYFN